MTVNAVAFYAVAVLIVVAAAAAVGLPSLRFASYAGAATVVLLAILDIITGAYALAAIEIVVPGMAVGVVVLVLRRHQYRELAASSNAGSRWWLGGPVALIAGLVLVVTLAIVGSQWYTDTGNPFLVALHPSAHAALISVLHWDAPYALMIALVLIAATVAAGLVIGRRSGDEQTLDQHLQARREREERARRRRDDRQAGRRRPAKEDS